MSTITLNEIITAAKAIDAPNMTTGEIVAMLITSIDAANLDKELAMRDDAMSRPARKAPARKPAAKAAATIAPKRAKKVAEVKSAATLRTTLDGRMMSSEPGSITNGQKRRNAAYAEANGFEATDISSYSMADAADDLFTMKAEVAAA